MISLPPTSTPLRIFLSASLFAAAAEALARHPSEDRFETTPTPRVCVTRGDLDYAAELARVKILVRANALELAETILRNRAPSLCDEIDATRLNWQRQLWQVHRSRRQWHALYLHANEIAKLDSLPLAFRQEAELHAADALLADAPDKQSAARAYLRAALLSPDASPAHVREIRRRIMESYLRQDRARAAQIALQQFQRDYRADDADWLMLAARVQLQSGDAEAAVNLLAPLPEPAAKLLALFARVKSGLLADDEAVKHLAAFRKQHRLPDLVKPALGALIFALAKDSDADKSERRAKLLETYLALNFPTHPKLRQALPHFTARDLLQAYQDIARARGNRAGLLSGDDESFLRHARELPEDAAVARRALFAHVVAHAEDQNARQAARDALVRELLRINRVQLVAPLFSAETLGELKLSGASGLQLANVALAQGDIQLAADASDSLLDLPPDMSRDDWLLHSARIAVTAGRHAQGDALLREYLAALETLAPEQTDKILQVVFDLQTAGRHQLALSLFAEIDRRNSDERRRREIAYWVGESFFAETHYLRAADQFLFSAMQQEDGLDQWGAAARYKAAEALMHAELYADARTLFQDLLAHAVEENRRTSLQQKLQQVQLRESRIVAE